MCKTSLHSLSYFLLLILSLPSCSTTRNPYPPTNEDHEIEILIGTFRGNEQRNYYGTGDPGGLEIIWKFYLGEGVTVISRAAGSRIWAGAGWTGQALLVKEGSEIFLIQGAYDHHLRKINAANGTEVWKYLFDDVVKGTGSLWYNPYCQDYENSILIFQGSRLGVDNFLDSKHVPSFRSVSYFTGKESWRLDVKWTDSYSRDADGSCLVINDTIYMALENSLLTVINTDPSMTAIKDSMLQPQILKEVPLYTNEDVIAHKNNIVTESSPARLGDHLYIASGSGHVYGYNLLTGEIDWDFYIGSDLDGSVVITSDSCILVPVEKQYIEGNGGVFKLDPSSDPENSVVWFLAVEDTLYEGWEGGVIGTPGINDLYIAEGDPRLSAISALDGFLYIVRHDMADTLKRNPGPDGKTMYPAPTLIQKFEIGPSISSPVITSNKVIAAGYNGIYLFEYDNTANFRSLAHYASAFEASPVIWNNNIYIASRDGYLYCFGTK